MLHGDRFGSREIGEHPAMRDAPDAIASLEAVQIATEAGHDQALSIGGLPDQMDLHISLSAGMVSTDIDQMVGDEVRHRLDPLAIQHRDPVGEARGGTAVLAVIVDGVVVIAGEDALVIITINRARQAQHKRMQILAIHGSPASLDGVLSGHDKRFSRARCLRQSVV